MHKKLMSIGILILYTIPVFLYPNQIHKDEIFKIALLESDGEFRYCGLDLLTARESLHKFEIKSREKLKEENKVTEDIEWINIRVSYYTISKQCTGKLTGTTASGFNLKEVNRGGSGIHEIHYIAAPKTIPFGTRLQIEGLGLCEVVDRGGAIKWKGNIMKIDVFVPNATNEELMKKGVMNTRGHIIK